MSQTYSRSKKQNVYFPVGKFDGEQIMKFVQAPFCVVKINGALYVEPMGFRKSTDAIAQFSNADTEIQALGFNQWFLDLEPIIIGEHEMGSLEQNNWKSFQRFGHI